MADHVDQVNMNDLMLTANTFSIKEEQCEGDSFIEDEVRISETGDITMDNSELQDHDIWQDKLMQYDAYKTSDNIRTELASFEVIDIQNDNVKVKEEITPETEFVKVEEEIAAKIEFDNGHLYCEHCKAYYQDYCTNCGMLVHILNKYAQKNADSAALDDIPNDILEIRDGFEHTGVYALRIIPAAVKFGPFTGLSGTECPWEMKEEKFVLEKNKWKYLNWMQYINPTRSISEGNLQIFQCEDNIYCESTRPINAYEELLIHFGVEDGSSPNKIGRLDFVTVTKDIINDVFACTSCCLGFSSISHLAKHKTICVQDTAGKFSIEELAQCQVCKIHLGLNEYLADHMAFCYERNARMGVLPTPPPKQAKITLNGRKRCLRQIYKCEQCKYRTKCQADLKEHTNNQHYKFKIYKCGICSRRFKTKGFLRIHVKNTHVCYVGKDDQEHSKTDYSITNIEVEQSSSRDQTNVFKCSLCVYQGNHKSNFRRHIQSKHLKQFDYKCDSCEYGTNNKSHLGTHIKTKHLKQFDYRCDSCEFGTNHKCHLERHIKTNHLKQFDYKCDSCEFGTNQKSDLERHIKTMHLNQFDYQCESCEFGANQKRYLERHIKTIHLNQFDYQCESCEFGTNMKSHLERHIKSKHLKQFNYTCDSCEYGTNIKCNLERHIKTKHLKQFDYKCDSCEFGTNLKSHLKIHIKSKHLKEFDYKCDSCEFGTNLKSHLERHIKTKHLEEFNYTCDL